ncbi:MAG: NifU family protein [Pyrinomonadaceae bacterium]
MQNEKDFQKRMQKIEALTGEIEALPDENARSKAIELMQLLMEYHGAAIERVTEIIAKAGMAGNVIFNDLAKDDLAGSLLLLYGLHPLKLETRIEQALDKVRPFLKSHGGNAELIGVEDGVVRLRMVGSCNGCPSSSATLKQSIEQAIYEAAPDVLAIEAEGAIEEPKRSKLVQIKGIQNTSPALQCM